MARPSSVGVCKRKVSRRGKIVECGGMIKENFDPPTKQGFDSQTFLGHSATLKDHVCEKCGHSYGIGYVQSQVMKEVFS